MDIDFWEFEIPEARQNISYWELIARQPDSPEGLRWSAAKWCETLQLMFDNEAEASAVIETMVDDRIKPYVRDLLPFYFLGGSADDLP